MVEYQHHSRLVERNLQHPDSNYQITNACPIELTAKKATKKKPWLDQMSGTGSQIGACARLRSAPPAVTANSNMGSDLALIRYDFRRGQGFPGLASCIIHT